MLLGLSLVFSGVDTACASSDISDRLDRIAKNLTAGYRAKHSKAGRETLAVLPFNSEERLAKARVGFAVSELLTHHLVTLQEFTAVERGELHRVLEEQRLQLSGAIDPAGAVRVGKILGVRLIVLGSVEKLGGQYQVNARIVEVETGEVLSTAYAEMPAELFEETAKPYLLPVPERQAIGIYFLYNFRSNPNDLAAYRFSYAYGTAVATPESFPMSLVGGGIRYFPWSEYMLDFSIAILSSKSPVASARYETGFSAGAVQTRQLSKVFVPRGTLNWAHSFSKSFRSIIGAGIAAYRVSPTDISFDTAIVPALRAGIEYKPQERVGLALFANYDFLNTTGTDARTPYADALRLSRWSVEPTIALYF